MINDITLITKKTHGHLKAVLLVYTYIYILWIDGKIMVQQAQSQATRITSSHRAVSESSSATKPVPEEMSENQKLVPPQKKLLHISMDWFKRKHLQESPIFTWKIYGCL